MAETSELKNSDEVKQIAFQAKRDGRRGAMHYAVYVKGPKVPLPFQVVEFENRIDAIRLIDSFIEYQGFKRVSLNTMGVKTMGVNSANLRIVKQNKEVSEKGESSDGETAKEEVKEENGNEAIGSLQKLRAELDLSRLENESLVLEFRDNRQEMRTQMAIHKQHRAEFRLEVNFFKEKLAETISLSGMKKAK